MPQKSKARPQTSASPARSPREQASAEMLLGLLDQLAGLDSLEAQALSAGDTSAVQHLVRVRAAKGSEQLFLFGPKDPARAAPDPEENGAAHEVLEKIETVDVDGLSPRDALDLVAKLQSELRKSKRKRS